MKYWDCFANNIEIIEPVSGQTGSILKGNDLGWKSLNYWLWIIVYNPQPERLSVKVHDFPEYKIFLWWLKVYENHVIIKTTSYDKAIIPEFLTFLKSSFLINQHCIKIFVQVFLPKFLHPNNHFHSLNPKFHSDSEFLSQNFWHRTIFT